MVSGARQQRLRHRLAAVQQRIYIAWDDLNQRRPPVLPRVLRKERSRAGAVGAACPAQRSDADVRQRRDGAVQERFHRARNPALQPGDELAEVRPCRRQAQRSRQRRLYRAAPHLLRNAREFFVRRLFQGPGDRACLDLGHEGVGARSRPADRDRLSHGRRSVRLVEENHWPAGKPNHQDSDQGQFLGHGRRWPVRPLLGNLLRPWRPYPWRATGKPR